MQIRLFEGSLAQSTMIITDCKQNLDSHVKSTYRVNLKRTENMDDEIT